LLLQYRQNVYCIIYINICVPSLICIVFITNWQPPRTSTHRWLKSSVLYAVYNASLSKKMLNVVCFVYIKICVQIWLGCYDWWGRGCARARGSSNIYFFFNLNYFFFTGMVGRSKLISEIIVFERRFKKNVSMIYLINLHITITPNRIKLKMPKCRTLMIT